MPRTIIIRPALNGFVCEVGCQSVVFTSIDKLVDAIGCYYKDPERVEKEFVASAVNKMLSVPMPPPTTEYPLAANDATADNTEIIRPMRSNIAGSPAR